MKATAVLIACGLVCAVPAVAGLPEVLGTTAPDAPSAIKDDQPRPFSSQFDASLTVPLAAALPALDLAALEAEDATLERMRTGVSRNVRIGVADGAWTRIDHQCWLWSAEIASTGATSLRLHFSRLDLSRGARLVVYAPSNPEDLAGPFAEKDVTSGELWTSPVSGALARVELLVPVESAEPPHLDALETDMVLHGYRDLSKLANGGASVDGSCGQEVACQPAWASIARAVGFYEFVAKTGKSWPYPVVETYGCAGTLLNSLSGDLTPYFLTDNKCYDDAGHSGADVVYWDYRSPTCGGSPPLLSSVPKSVGVGSLKRTAYANLLMIAGTLPPNRQWVGWSTNPLSDGTPVTGVGHGFTDQAEMIVYSGTKIVGDGVPLFCGVPANPIEIASATGSARNGTGLFRSDTQQLIGHEWCHHQFACLDAIYAGFATTYADFASYLAGGTDDDLEDNDVCTVPYFVSSSLQFNDLVVKSTDPDWYRIRLLSGQTVTVSSSFTHSHGDIDMRLYDSCGGSLVASSTGTSDTENITYAYGGAGQHDFFLNVYLFSDTRNSYVMSITYGLPANLNASVTPAGFASPAVPRVSGDATTSSATLPAELIGDTYSTWVNWAVQQTGSGALAQWEGQLWLDDESVPGYWTFFAPVPSLAGMHYQLNVGPNTVRGGRHSLVSVADGIDLVPETNESDNVWRGQWVWRPPQTTANVPLERDVPPAVGLFTQPNSDGFRFDRPSSYAWVTGLAPTTVGDDYDLYVYDDYVGSTSGFSNQIGGSAGLGVSTDFVVGHYTDVQTTLYPAAVRWAAPNRGPCLVDQSDASLRNVFGLPASFLDQVLSANRLVDVYEVRLDPGQTCNLKLSRRSGSADVAFQAFPATAGGIWSRDDPSAAASVAVGADLDTLAFTGDGWHPVVVYRLWGNEASGPVSYDLFFNAQPIVDVTDEHRTVELAFSGARPNPVERATTFSFTLPQSGRARLTIFDVNGRAVARVLDEFLDAGPHAVPWTARRGADRLEPGLYWSRLEWEGRSLVKSIAVLR